MLSGRAMVEGSQLMVKTVNIHQFKDRCGEV